MWLNCHRQCCKSQLGSHVMKVKSFFSILESSLQFNVFHCTKNTKLFLLALDSTEANQSPTMEDNFNYQAPEQGWKCSSLSEELLLVRSWFCTYPVGFVLHDLSFKRFYFLIFLLPRHWIHFHSQEKEDPVFTCSNCTCFTASSINLVKQTIHKTGGKM